MLFSLVRLSLDGLVDGVSWLQIVVFGLNATGSKVQGRHACVIVLLLDLGLGRHGGSGWGVVGRCVFHAKAGSGALAAVFSTEARVGIVQIGRQFSVLNALALFGLRLGAGAVFGVEEITVMRKHLVELVSRDAT